MFWLRNKENNFQFRTFIWRADLVALPKDRFSRDEDHMSSLWAYLLPFSFPTAILLIFIPSLSLVVALKNK